MTTEPRYADVVAGVQAALSAYVHALTTAAPLT
jgi:hypothetical protein